MDLLVIHTGDAVYRVRDDAQKLQVIRYAIERGEGVTFYCSDRRKTVTLGPTVSASSTCH